MLNKIQLIGRVGKDSETHTFSNGNKVVSFNLATSDTFKDKNGEKQTVTEWHTIKVFGKLSEVAEKYVRKGQLLYLDGQVKYKKFEKDSKTTYFTEVHVFTLKMLSKPDQSNAVQESKPSQENETNDGDQDLPF